MIAGFALCLAIGYAAGRRAAPREPLHFIGAPIDPAAGSAREDKAAKASDGRQHAQDGRQPLSALDAGVGICGAITKSGKPCRRKVVGGGHCWQHRGMTLPGKISDRGPR